jgi:hypothetical protein
MSRERRIFGGSTIKGMFAPGYQGVSFGASSTLIRACDAPQWLRLHPLAAQGAVLCPNRSLQHTDAVRGERWFAIM